MSKRRCIGRKTQGIGRLIDHCEQRQMLSAVSASYDGTDNNIGNPEWGSTDVELIRLSQAEYEDGYSNPSGYGRPSARHISNQIAAQDQSIANDRNMTDFVWIWGQFLDHDIDLTEGAEPHEEFNIEVPTGDPHFDPFGTGNQEIGLNRSVYVKDAESSDGLRQQINQITAFIDGSVVYGSDQDRAHALRTFSGGRMKTSAGDLLPFNEAGLPNAGGPGSNLFLAGDIRANENAVLSSMHTLFIREHNRIADELAADEPSLTDEEIYQRARSIVGAEIQVITYNEFLPALLGLDALPDYYGYDPTVNPGIANEFSTAAYRLGHSLLSSELQRLDADGNVVAEGNLSLANAFFNPQALIDHGIDSLLRGASTQAAQELDNMIVDDVRNFLFGPPGAGGLDLASLNIQRGRDHGLADYNQTRVDLGLPAVTSFSEITSNADLAQTLEDTYGSVDEIDLWVGGLAEDHLPGGSLGETFTTIVADQFIRLRAGDRYWYQNVFTGDQLAEIEQTRLSDVIERNTNVAGLQQNVFFLKGTEIISLNLEELGSHRIRIRKSGEEIHVQDQNSDEIIFRQTLDQIGGLIIHGENNVYDKVVISAELSEADLPFGIRLFGGYEGDDKLIIAGTDDNDLIMLDGVQIDANSLDVIFEEFERVELNGNDGDDHIEALYPMSRKLTISGGRGNDTLIGSENIDHIFGNQGNDIIKGRDGDDFLFGGPGMDQIFGGGGIDVIHGGAGIDFILQDDECESEAEWAAYAAHIGAQMNMTTNGNFYENWGGAGERWIWGSGAWHFITPDGRLYRWDGSARQATGQLIVTLNSACYNDPWMMLNHQTNNQDGDEVTATEDTADQVSNSFWFRSSGNFYENWGGAGERWIWGRGGWYFIRQDGNLYRWDGNHRRATGHKIAELSIDYFDNPLLICN